MSYKIVVDSCCELPEKYKKDERFEIVPLGLEVGNYQIMDDETFNQKEFLEKVAACPTCPKSSCPSPERFREAYHCEAEDIFVVTLSSKLSGSYNSAVLGKNLYHEKYGDKNIFVCDSESASCGETHIAMKAMEYEEAGISFNKIVENLQVFVKEMHTYFVLDNLETLRKNGRLTGVKALVASTLNIKPVMGAINGSIVQKSQAIGIKKGLMKMAQTVVNEVKNSEEKVLMITHCNCPDRAKMVEENILSKIRVKDVLLMNTAGVSSMYANNGGVIVTI